MLTTIQNINNFSKELINIRNACGSRIVLDGKSCIAPIDDKAFFDKCLMYSESKNLHAKKYCRMEANV